jgi:hypothetical protein
MAKSFDTIVGSGKVASRKALLKTVIIEQIRDTFGLPHSIFYWLGRNMMANNVDTTDGIVNGAVGTLQKTQYATIKTTGARKSYRGWILFDDSQTGSEALRKSRE